jgi:hypothetical protein
MIIKMEVERSEGSNKETYAKPSKDEPFSVVEGRRPSWMFIDDLHSPEVHDISDDFVPPDTMFDVFYLNVIRDTGPNTRILIKAQDSSGKNVGIVCERAAYLLNDNGKTIERLN